MQPELQPIILRTLLTATASTLMILPVALLFGWVLARKEFHGKAIFEALLNLPMVVPPVVTGYILLHLLGRRGLLGEHLRTWFGIELSFNFAALVVASAAVSLPLAVRATRSGFELVDKRLEDAARTLGAPPWAVFFHVTLPLIGPALMAGAVLAFARALGEFGATITLAGNIPGKTQTIALAIYSQLQIPGSDPAAWQLVGVSLALAFAALAAAETFHRRIKNRS